MKSFILSSLCFVAASAFSQGEFVRVYDQLTDNTSNAYSVAATHDGGYICIGNTNADRNADVFMIKTNDTGGAQWAKQLSGTQQTPDVALDIVPTSDGGYVFCGNSDHQRVIWKVDSEGHDLWTAHFGPEGHEAYNAVVETTDGGFLAVSDGMMITKTDANGKELWTRNKPTEHASAYRAIKELPNGDVLIGGFFTARDGGHPVSILIKTDADGKAYWAQTYGAGMINAIDTDSEGNIWVSGSASYSAPIVLKIDYTGNAIWEGVYEEKGMGIAHSIVVKSPNEALVFTSGGYFSLNSKGELQEKQTTPNYGFNDALITGNGEMVLAGFSNESITNTEKFAFMKIGPVGFPSPSASIR